MLIEKGKCKTVNATYEIWDDAAKPFSEEEKSKIEERCAEIVLPHKIRSIAKNTA